MPVVVGTDSYGDEAGLQSYADARGVTISGDLTILLIKAMDYLESQAYLGVKYVETQPLEFPRSPTLYGDVEGEVPARIIQAQYVAALLTDGGENLNPVVGRERKRVRIEGAVDTTYMDDASPTNTYPQLYRLTSDYLGSGSGSLLAVVI